MASAIRKILLKKGINAAGKSGLGFIFDGKDKMRIYKNCQKRFVSWVYIIFQIECYIA